MTKLNGAFREYGNAPKNSEASTQTAAIFTSYQYLHKRFVSHPHAIKQALPNPHEVIIRKLCNTIINHQ
jgi:hypothetical protein